jgi:hypothetical protein
MSEENLLSIGELLNKKVFVAHKKKEDTYRRIGKVRRFVFHPTEKRVIGFIMKRPDMAMMFHRPDQFVAIDRVEVVEGGIIVEDAADTFDQKACLRFGVDWARWPKRKATSPRRASYIGTRSATLGGSWKKTASTAAFLRFLRRSFSSFCGRTRRTEVEKPRGRPEIWKRSPKKSGARKNEKARN